MPLEDLADKAKDWGYNGLELACWGNHFNVRQALEDSDYCQGRRDLLGKYCLAAWAISNHLVGQCVCDPIDERHKGIVPEYVWGDGNPEGVRVSAAEEMKNTAVAAAELEVKVVNGFTGSSIWHKFYGFPPISSDQIEDAFEDFAVRWLPILDVFDRVGVRFALEVHPTEIAYDIETAARAFEAVEKHPAFGFNFDPSHLRWQGIDPVEFLKAFPDRIFHVHLKDVRVQLDGQNSILGGHLPFGHVRRGWDFCSLGYGDVNFEAILRALNQIGYDGPLSIEWEDPTMDREFGAQDALRRVREMLYPAAAGAFDAAFSEGRNAAEAPDTQ